MHTRLVKPRQGPELLVRPLVSGDVATVAAVFARLGERSRRARVLGAKPGPPRAPPAGAVSARLGERSRGARFLGPKPCLSVAELEQLANVDARRHALVGYVEGDPEPAAIASLVRNGRDSAEIAFAVADEYQHRG